MKYQVLFSDGSFSGLFPTREEAQSFADDERDTGAKIREV